MDDTKPKAVVVEAVIDRYEGDQAVLLLGEDERSVVFPARFLPTGLDEGAYLRIEIAFDAEATVQAQREAADLLRELQERNV